MVDISARDVLMRLKSDVGTYMSQVGGAISGTQALNREIEAINHIKVSNPLGNIATEAMGYATGRAIEKGFEKGIEGIESGVNFLDTIQQSTIAFETMTKSADTANKMVSDLWSMAKDTPLEFPTLLTASKRMEAFRFSTQEIIPDLKAIGDASSGLSLGAEGVDRISLALGQAKSKRKITGDDMRQLSEAGINAWEYLATAIGKTTAETQKLSEKGLIPANEAIQVIIQGMEKDFGGMMEKQSKTFSGLMSTLKDSTNEAFATVIKPEFNEFTNSVLPSAIEKINDFTDGFKNGGIEGGIEALFPPDAAKAIETVMDSLQSAGSVAGSALQSVAGPAATITKAVLEWKPLIPTILGVVTAMSAMSVANSVTPAIITLGRTVEWFGMELATGSTLTEAFVGTMGTLMGPAGWITLGIGAVVGITTALVSYNTMQEQSARATVDAANAAAENYKKQQDLIDKYIDLKSKAGDSAQKTDELKQVTQQLTDAIPGATAVINSQTTAYRDQKIALEELIRTQTKGQLESGYLDASKNIDAQKKSYEDAASKEAFLRRTQGKTWQEAGYKNYSEYEADYNKNISFWDATQSVWGAATSGNANFYDKDMLSKAIKNKDETEKALKASQNAMDAWNKFQTQGGGNFSPNFSGGSAPSDVQDKLKAIADANGKVGDGGKTAAELLAEAMAKMAGSSDSSLKKYQSALKSFIDGVESMQNKLAGFSSFFDKLTFERFSPEKLKARLERYYQEFQKWRDNIASLMSKGVDTDTINSLRDMGMSGAGVAAGLNQMSPTDLIAYLGKIQTIRAGAGQEAFRSEVGKLEHKVYGEVTVKGVTNSGEFKAAESLIAQSINQDGAGFSLDPSSSKKVK